MEMLQLMFVLMVILVPPMYACLRVFVCACESGCNNCHSIIVLWCRVSLTGGRALTSTERAVEVLAAMVGQSYVKDELVHGSYR